jgi:hypothetical protein
VGDSGPPALHPGLAQKQCADNHIAQPERVSLYLAVRDFTVCEGTALTELLEIRDDAQTGPVDGAKTGSSINPQPPK